MSEKSGWLGSIIGGRKQTAKPLATSAKRCAAGHPMAMDWQSCPYCDAAKNAADRTRVTGAGTSAWAASPPQRPGPTRINDPEPAGATAGPGGRAPAGSRRETVIDGGMSPGPSPSAGMGAPPAQTMAAGSPGPSSRRHTSVMDPEDMANQARRQPAGGGRGLTGIVYTFSWSKLGQLFEVRDGRNYVGSGVVGTEGGRQADVLVTEDDKLSGAHFLILCQGDRYRIRDCDSTNGTYVNGEQIDALGIDLADGSLIQAGATLFVFQKVRPPSSTRTQAEPPPDDPGVSSGAPTPPPWDEPTRAI